MANSKRSVRNLVLVLGDQLDRESSALAGFDPGRDAILMAEVSAESTHVWSNKVRTVCFLSAMRHHAAWLTGRGFRVEYTRLDDPANTHTLAGELRRAVERLRPAEVIVSEVGDDRVARSLRREAETLKIELEVRPDAHFLCTLDEFRAWAKGKKQLRMEFFYRVMRRKHNILMDGDEPEGGKWNYDADNRGSFGKAGPGKVPSPVAFAPDAITKEVIAAVQSRFGDHPGDLSKFDWPMTPEQADEALADFIAHRLGKFGEFQDAMWTNQPWLYHARLSMAMNLKLLNPLKVVLAAQEAYRQGKADLAGVEGFIRQVLGWREYVRGIYYQYMPEYLERNALKATQPLPKFYWTGDTEMACLADALKQTLDLGYAHHIQRLMVTGLYSLMLAVAPKEISDWYLAVYVDAVEWVEVPNVIGMSQFADGGTMASKPYVATGKYIQRMSDYCKGCRFDPAESTGEDACPFTTLYWDFLMRHAALLKKNVRMSLQVKNLMRLDGAEQAKIRERAQAIRDNDGEPKRITLPMAQR